MQIQVSTDTNVGGGDEFTNKLKNELEAALSRFSDQLTRVEVHLGDESAGRPSGDDKRCLLEARPAGRAPMVVTHHAETVDAAVRGATHKLVSVLEKEAGRSGRDRKGGDSIRGGQSD